jgi:hypothetical protein
MSKVLWSKSSFGFVVDKTGCSSKHWELAAKGVDGQGTGGGYLTKDGCVCVWGEGGGERKQRSAHFCLCVKEHECMQTFSQSTKVGFPTPKG